MCTYMTCSESLHDQIQKSKGSSGNLTQVDGPTTPLDTNEPTAPYIIGVEPTTFRTAATDDDKD